MQRPPTPCRRLSWSPGSPVNSKGSGGWVSLLPYPSIFSYSSLSSPLVLATANRYGIQPNSHGCLTYYGVIRLDLVVNGTILDCRLGGGASLHLYAVRQSQWWRHGQPPPMWVVVSTSPHAPSWQGLSLCCGCLSGPGSRTQRRLELDRVQDEPDRVWGRLR